MIFSSPIILAGAQQILLFFDMDQGANAYGVKVTCPNVFSEEDRQFERIDDVVYVTPRVVIDTIGSLLKSEVNIYRVGDCHQSPPNLVAVIHNGHLAGLEL